MFRYTFILIGVVVIAAGCASVQERQAFLVWQEESRKRVENHAGDTQLPELDESATLDEFVLYALLNNPGLAAAFDRWKAALEKVAPARTLPDPRFTYANFIREVETRVGAQEHRFGVAQNFPWFGKLDLREEIALQTAHAEHQRYEAAKLALIFRVKKIYYEYCYLSQTIEIKKENVALLSYMESVARSKYKSGTGLQSAIIRTQVELGTLEDRLRSLQDLMTPVAAKLYIALNRPARTPVPAPEAMALPGEKNMISLMRIYCLCCAQKTPI
jgi:cobalt-zinc-cadmium efflux system outer membrane protein